MRKLSSFLWLFIAINLSGLSYGSEGILRKNFDKKEFLNTLKMIHDKGENTAEFIRLLTVLEFELNRSYDFIEQSLGISYVVRCTRLNEVKINYLVDGMMSILDDDPYHIMIDPNAMERSANEDPNWFFTTSDSGCQYNLTFAILYEDSFENPITLNNSAQRSCDDHPITKLAYDFAKKVKDGCDSLIKDFSDDLLYGDSAQ